MAEAVRPVHCSCRVSSRPNLREDDYAQMASIAPVGDSGLSACSAVRGIG